MVFAHDTDSRGASPRRARTRVVPGLVFLALATPLVAGWFIAERTQHEAHDRQLEVAARQAALRLRDFLDARLLVVDTLRSEWEAGSFPEGRGFALKSGIVQGRFGGFRAINWVDADGTIRIVAPYPGNEAAQGKDLSQRPDTLGLLEAARATGEPSVSPPLRLYQGPVGIATYFPIHGGDGGFVNGVFEVAALVEDCLRTGLLEHHRITIHDGDELVYSSPGSPDPVEVSADAAFRLGGREWRLEIHPRPSFWRDQHHTAHHYALAFGVLLAAGIARRVQVALRRRRTMERERERRAELEARLREAEKLEALGRLAGGIAHDFNNALTVILGNLSLLHDQVDEDGRALLAEIEVVAGRATDMTSQLLAYAKREVVQAVPLDLGRHVEGLRSMLRRLVREDVALEFAAGAGPLQALADPAAVDRILVNLVLNAADAIAGRGSIRVLVEAREGDEELGAGAWVVLVVVDDGAGIPPEDRPHIFEPFYSTKTPAKGTGLGLPSVYGLAAQLGGRVTFETEVGRGSRFTVWLPRASPPPGLPGPPETPSTESISTRQSGIVLVVEDDEAVRRMVATHLRRSGFEVWEAADGERALALDLSRPALAVVDLVMPGVGGAEVARRLREANPTLGIVLCSGHAAEPEALRAALRDPRVEFLPKPFVMKQLREALGRVYRANSSSRNTS